MSFRFYWLLRHQGFGLLLLTIGGGLTLGWGQIAVGAATPLDPQAIFDEPLQAVHGDGSMSGNFSRQPTAGAVPVGVASHLTPLQQVAGTYRLYSWELSNTGAAPVEIVQAEVTNGLDARMMRQLSTPVEGFHPVSGQYWRQRGSELRETLGTGWQLPALSHWWSQRKIAPPSNAQATEPSEKLGELTMGSATFQPETPMVAESEDAWLTLPNFPALLSSRHHGVVRSLTHLSLAPGQKMTFRVAVPAAAVPEIRWLMRDPDSPSIGPLQ